MKSQKSRKRKDAALCERSRNINGVPIQMKSEIVRRPKIVRNLSPIFDKVASLQMELSQVKSKNTALQEQVLKLENSLKEKDDINEKLLKKLEELEKENEKKEKQPEQQSTLHKMNLLERESSLKEFEIRELRENLSLQKYIAQHLALSKSKAKRRPYTKAMSVGYAPSVCSSTVSTTSLLQKKYERSSHFEAKSGMELPIKLFDCYLDDDGSLVEIDIVKIPSSREVRVRVKSEVRTEDLDIRDVYANIVNETLFHLETFDNGYYLCSRQSHISVQEIVEDINAFQSDGFLPDRQIPGNSI